MGNEATHNRVRLRRLLLGAGALLIVSAIVVFALVPGARDLFRSAERRAPEPTPAALATVEPAPTPAPSPVVSVATLPSTSAPAPTASPIPPAEFDDLLAEAGDLTARSKFEGAAIIYQYLAEAAPGDARPEIGWAWALILDNEAYQALAHAQRAVELDDGAEAAAVLARANIDLGEEADALIQAQSAVELDPQDATARAILADAYSLNDQPQDAVEEADRALALDRNSAEAHRIRGWLYQRIDGDPVQAAAELQTAAGLQPDLWLRRYELGLLLLQAQNYDTAISILQDSLALRPEPVTYTALGQAAYWLEDYDQGRAWLEQALAAGAQDATTYSFLAASLAALARCDDAQAAAATALGLEPAQPQALEAQALCQAAGAATPPATSTVGAPTAGTPAAGATQPPTAPPTTATLPGWIAFPVWNPAAGKYDTYVARAQDGSERRLVVAEMHQPALSPDGQWLALNGERADHMNLFLARVDGTALEEITNFIEDGQAAWSPDGTKLAFASTRHGDKQFRVYVVDDVPFGGWKVDGRTLNYGPDDVRGQMPAWTSGGRIVYRGCSPDSPRGECSGLGLFVMSAEPGPQTPQQITEDPSDTAPAVMGDRVAFMSNRDGNWEIYVANLDGTGLRRLSEDAAADGLPIWSPDGKTLAFASDRGGQWAVWAMNPDGTGHRKLFDLGGGGLAYDWLQERITWAP